MPPLWEKRNRRESDQHGVERGNRHLAARRPKEGKSQDLKKGKGGAVRGAIGKGKKRCAQEKGYRSFSSGGGETQRTAERRGGEKRIPYREEKKRSVDDNRRKKGGRETL